MEGKTVAQASSVRLGAGMQMQLNRLGIRVVKKVKNLGVQFVAGGKRSFINQRARDRYKEGFAQAPKSQHSSKSSKEEGCTVLVRAVLYFWSLCSSLSSSSG